MAEPVSAESAGPTGKGAADIAAARRVLGIESGALEALSAALDDSFAAAIEVLLGVKGRVVVSGMGKSGHVGAKIAATFASTGTPAQFVHPAEASHGDLGMIAPGDAVLMLSNSGETRELADMIHHTRRRAIPLIGVASKADSTLLRAADVAIVLPQAEEACPMGLAPTTSTTMTLALGDALAVALMERRGFDRDQYKDFHPGGSLGQALMRVRELMHGGADLPLVPDTVSMAEAVRVLTEKRFGCVGIVDPAGALSGIVTDGDLRRRFGEAMPADPVTAFMTHRPRTIAPEALVSEALGVLNRGKITTLFVTEAGSGAPLGLLHIHDCLKAGFT